MKIIGITGTGYDSRRIVEIDEHEFESILGYGYNEMPRQVRDQLKAGTELPVGKIFSRLREINDHANYFRQAQEALQRAQDLIGVTRDAVASLMKVPDEKGGAK